MKYEESPVLELKEQINADFKKEIIAFANTDGGEILVGVARDGSVAGVEDTEAEMEKIGNMIRDGIKPDLTAYTSIERIEDGGKALIRVSVSRGLKRPYHLTDKGLKPTGVFVRHGVSSVPATDEAIRQMLRESDGTAFDKARSVNQELTFSYAEKTFQERQIAFDNAHKRTLGLIDVDGYYTNAALLLSDPVRTHHPLCRIRGDGKNEVQDPQGVFRLDPEANGRCLFLPVAEQQPSRHL